MDEFLTRRKHSLSSGFEDKMFVSLRLKTNWIQNFVNKFTFKVTLIVNNCIWSSGTKWILLHFKQNVFQHELIWDKSSILIFKFRLKLFRLPSNDRQKIGGRLEPNFGRHFAVHDDVQFQISIMFVILILISLLWRKLLFNGLSCNPLIHRRTWLCDLGS